MSCRMQTSDPKKTLPCKHYLKSDIKGHAGFCKLPTRFLCEEALKSLNPTLTMSAYKAFLQCPYKYYLSYIRSIRKKDSKLASPLKVGSIWDTFIDMMAGGDTITFAESVDKYQLSDIEIAKIRGVIRAFRELEIKIEPGAETQKHLTIPISGINNVTGYSDLMWPDHMAEVKMSGRPDFYLQPENIRLQIGTYMMSDDKIEYCDMLITKFPQLRISEKKGENNTQYEDRIFSTVIGSPSEYFLGFKRESRTYGHRFFRSEFDLERIRANYAQGFRLLRFYMQSGEWLANSLSCHVPAPCEYLDHCRTGKFSEIIYREVLAEEAAEGLR